MEQQEEKEILKMRAENAEEELNQLKQNSICHNYGSFRESFVGSFKESFVSVTIENWIVDICVTVGEGSRELVFWA